MVFDGSMIYFPSIDLEAIWRLLQNRQQGGLVMLPEAGYST